METLRDRYDRGTFRDGVGLGLIGMPGLEKRLARSPRRDARVGFVHQDRPLGAEELGLTFAPDDCTDAEARGALTRATGGNVRLIQRLFAQIARILEINSWRTITGAVVEAACEQLVIGPL